MDDVSGMIQKIRDRSVEDDDFRQRLLSDPGGTIEAEYNLPLPEGVSLEVHEESPATAHLVLPPSSQLTQEALDALGASGGFCQENDGDLCGTDNW